MSVMPASYSKTVYDFQNNQNDFQVSSGESELLNVGISVAKEASPEIDIFFNRYDDIYDEETTKLINQLQKRILIFANILSQIDLFKHEYYMAMSVHNMFDYIFKNEVLLKKNIDFLMKATNDFFHIFNFKCDNLSKINSDKTCFKEYKKLSRNFSKTQRYFYKEIYVSKCDEKFVNGMIKTLMG